MLLIHCLGNISIISVDPITRELIFNVVITLIKPDYKII
ncbi:hypothetical protein NITHO_6400001 [Nitrolancea hollandica Lb]|uniref:Uncharacterized protein n=1 Tax=Nitrolancea hollandica Lb TaxID=1129897 RepID=I4EMR3_9BACT|nr:hypothetical protein NITHO_6400001 [Nitrolancea hollandica Lb]